MRMALEQAEQARRLGELPVGCVVVKAAWELADILNACMALPNLTALLLLWRQVVEGSRRPAEKRNYVN